MEKCHWCGEAIEQYIDGDERGWKHVNVDYHRMRFWCLDGRMERVRVQP